MSTVKSGTVNPNAPSPSESAEKHDPQAAQHRHDEATGKHASERHSTAKTDLGKPLIPDKEQTHKGRDNPLGIKAKEGELEKKEVIKFATLVLHDIRPQPRADEIEMVLDQLRLSEDSFTDPEAVKSAAKQLYDKSFPKSEEAKSLEGRQGEAPPSPASSPQA
jgi:hypothetical protein